MNSDDVTLQDCIAMHDQLGKCVILSGGYVIGFEKDTNTPSPARVNGAEVRTPHQYYTAGKGVLQ